MHYSELRPLNDDILVERIDPSEFKSSCLILDTKDTDDELNFFKVLKVGPLVTDVTPGDVVVLSWTRVTPPFDMESVKAGITSIKEVQGVIDYDD